VAYWDVFADVSYPPFVADDPGGLLPTEFDNLAYATITANTSWQLIALSTVLAVPNRLDVPAVVGFTTAAGMSIGLPAGWIAIDGDASFGAWSLDCALTRVISSPGNISTYTELVDTGFLGAWKGAVGPSGSVFIAGEESREIMCVEYSDAYKMRIVGRVSVDGRPTGIASTLQLPDIRADVAEDEKFLYILLEQTESPTGKAKLQCRGATFDMPLLNEIELERDVNPRILWAPNDVRDTDFIVLCGRDGAIQIRDATQEMAIQAQLGTGLYLPEVADVQLVKIPDCDSPNSCWRILVFSETSARGFVLQYEEVATTVTLAAPPLRISANVVLGEWTAQADLTSFRLVALDANSELNPFESDTWIDHFVLDYTGVAAASVLRPFTTDNTGEPPYSQNINAIEERIAADVVVEFTTDAALEVNP